MAKVSKKKAKTKNVKTAEQSSAENPDMLYDGGEDELVGADADMSSEEEEDGYDERKRQKLLEAISALGGKRKKTLGERSEAAVQMSEFTVNAEGEGDKIELSDLIGSMAKTPGLSGKTKKRLKNMEHSRKAIDCPLSKQESERIQRDLAFQKVSKEVSHWNSVITQNQRAEQLVFPLNQGPSGPQPMERVVVGWKAQTPLEQEVFSLLSANKQPINDPILTPTEEASMKAMSLEEAKIRRAELQKARALQSYYEAKARRQRKIKSKKYHKVQNKAKRKDFLKQFDEMVKKDPAAALEELNKMELARMQERMSLKHQNSGKWAKSKAIMAKYDEEARTAIQQQLEVNKNLTQKVVTSLNNEEEEEEEERPGDAEVLPDFVNDAEQGLDFSNPWLSGTLSQDPAEETSDAVTVTVSAEENVAEEEEVEETEEEALLREFDSRRKLRQAQEAETAAAIPVVVVVEEEEEDDDNDASDKEATGLLRGLAEGCGEADQAADTDTSAQLEEGLRIRDVEDVELLTQEEVELEEETTDKAPVKLQHPPATESFQNAGKTRKVKKGIELKQVLTKDTQAIQVPFTPTVEDTEDAAGKLDQRGLIKEAFAGDDIISDFLKDKKKQEDAGKAKVVDLTLPGWGEWGGGGLKPSRRKCRRFRIKTAPPPPRKDQHLPGVIISEKRNSSISLHQVNTLPFPFESPSTFENTIRSPLGRTWNTECTVKKVTKPKVVTRLGAIIKPMTREELVKDRKQAGNSRLQELKLVK